VPAARWLLAWRAAGAGAVLAAAWAARGCERRGLPGLPGGRRAGRGQPGPAVWAGRWTDGGGVGERGRYGRAAHGTGQRDDLRIALDGEQPGAGGAADRDQQGAAGQVLQDGWLDGVLVDALDVVRGAPAFAFGGGGGL
jgi:hypothetical protein